MDKLYSNSSNAILLFCITFLLPFSMAESITGYERDRVSLLAIKSQFHDPIGITNSWNNSISMCKWNGVKCGPRHQRVTELNLRFQHLGGSLSPFIGNLSFLRVINLFGNNIGGEIPTEIGKLFRLRTLDLMNNTFTGIIPLNLSNCYNLIRFGLGMNKLVGKIPQQLGYLSKLEMLYVPYNSLTGQLPDSIGNLSRLVRISVGGNKLHGRIPETLGQLRNLRTLILADNSFSGTISPAIYNLSSLQMFHVSQNQLHGALPQNMAFTLPNLEYLRVANNSFSGPVPYSIPNATNLVEIDISYNYFTGKVSLDFSSLKNLWWLSIGSNSLGSRLPDDLHFLNSLTNCTKLETLTLFTNQFAGMLPNSLANFSKTLKVVAFEQNLISGTLPQGIANLVNLEWLSLRSNQLTGPIPQSIGELTKLQLLSLAGNNFSGPIPNSIGNLTKLSKLYLNSNNLQGSIPPSLESCQILISLDLSQNKLSGVVPPQILNIVTLSIALDLSDNHLTGPFPLEVGNLKTLVLLNLSKNQFNGNIPATLGSCVSLEYLNLSGNSFNESIPQSLSSLKSTTLLDLSQNRLSGKIPKYFENLSLLQSLNLSYNHLEGEIPTGGIFKKATAISLIGNDELCGGLAEFHLPPCQLNGSNPSKFNSPLKIVLTACAILVFILLLFVLLCWFKKKGKKEPSLASFYPTSLLQLSYQQLLKATNGFSSTNLLGEGSFGRVYKGVLKNREEENGNVVAVKVINLKYRGASKSFIAECEALRNIRHRNLVKIISACSSIDFQGNSFKAIIYDFMSNGSLDEWLHVLPIENEGKTEPKGLSFTQRLNIAFDVASALDYLHHHSQVPIIHCDVKPSNVLLDNDMVAHLGDFGLARIFPEGRESVTENQTSSLGLKGTIGYVAPEYAMGSEPSKRGDTYSFGMLLLEMFTGKRPTNDAFKDGMNLHTFTKMALPEQVLQIADPSIICKDNEDDNNTNATHSQTMRNKMREWLISIFEIGVACSVESPKDRIDISDAARVLCSIKEELIKAESMQQKWNEIHEIR